MITSKTRKYDHTRRKTRVMWFNVQEPKEAIKVNTKNIEKKEEDSPVQV